MFFQLIQSAIAWLEANLFLVGIVMSITAYFKLFMAPFKWAQAWMITQSSTTAGGIGSTR